MVSLGRRAIWITVVVAAVGLAAVAKLRTSKGKRPAAAAGGGRGAPVSVNVEVASAQVLADVLQASGTLEANEEVKLVGESSGRVVQVLFAEGRTVRKGDLLVKINDAELQAQRTSTLGRLGLAQQGEARRSALLQAGGVSQEEYDQIRNQVNMLRAELGLIDAQIARTEIRAPFTGTIGLRHVSPGSYVTPLASVATLRQTDPIKLEFDVPERFANRVKVGAPVTFRTDASKTAYKARVYALEAGIEANTRSLRVRALSRNPTGEVRPGEFVHVELRLEEIPGALMIPSTALVSAGGRNAVFVSREGRAELVSVEVGLRTADRVQIISGISAGDSVITRGVQTLRSGSLLKVVAP